MAEENSQPVNEGGTESDDLTIVGAVENAADAEGTENENEDTDGTENEKEVTEGKEIENAVDEGRIIEPYRNMIFDTFDELYVFYRRYAAQKGFRVKKRTSSKGEDGTIKYVTISCSRQGKSVSKSRNPLKPRPTTRINCQARINANLADDGRWIVRGVELNHNHPLNPGRLPSYQVYTHKRPDPPGRPDLNDKSGGKVNKTSESLEVEFDGYKLTFSGKDCPNYVNKVGRLRLGDDDANALKNYCMKSQAVDSNFFYAMDLDEDNRLRNLFWADGRCRAAYEEFGDVIAFDTMYLISKYDLPLTSFIGVNHHGQLVLLGCAIISCQGTETYTWLFNTFLACMSGHTPNAIITDQDKDMKDVIRTVFPDTRHRWCLWHILKKLPEKLNGHKQLADIKALFQNVVYDSFIEDEFERGWSEMIQKYGLEQNSWLTELYDERARWVPFFVKDCFWAGLSTTRRSESWHAFFDGCVYLKTTLKQFLEQYDNAMRNKVEKENKADWMSFNAKIPFITRYAMEKQVQQVYTTAKFKEFQEELTGKMYCCLAALESHGTISAHEVSEDLSVGDNEMRRVKFRVLLIREEGKDCEVKCDCCMFESRGILCRHALDVLIDQEIYYIPAKYIIRRWRRDIKRRHVKVRVAYSDWSDTEQGRRFDNMCKAFQEIADIASESEEQCQEVMQWIQEMKAKVSNNDGVSGSSLSNPFAVVLGKGRKPGRKKGSQTITRSRIIDEIVGAEEEREINERKRMKPFYTTGNEPADVIRTQDGFTMKEPQIPSQLAQDSQSGIPWHMLPVNSANTGYPHQMLPANDFGVSPHFMMPDNSQRIPPLPSQPPRDVPVSFSNQQPQRGEVPPSSKHVYYLYQ